MSIIIDNINMPKTCWGCPFHSSHRDDKCFFTHNYTDDPYYAKHRQEDCPLIPITDDCISRDALKKDIETYDREFAPDWVISKIDNAPTYKKESKI